MNTENEIKFLGMSLDLAAENIKSGGGPFGAVIVRDGEVISLSGNRVVEAADPTAHAEILAIRIAAAKLGTHLLSDCILYTSCEPCPMCLGAIYWAGIERVVYSATREDAALAGFNDQYIYEEIALDPGSRHIKFLNARKERGIEVFRLWIDFPDKKTY